MLEYTDPNFSILNTAYDNPSTQYDISRIGALAKYSLIEDKNKLSFVLNYEENQNKITKERYFQYGSIPYWKFQNILSSVILQNKVNSVDIESALTFKGYSPLEIDYNYYGPNKASPEEASSDDLFDAQVMISLPFENYLIFANLAQTSRIPSMFELSAFSFDKEASNLELKPEISKNVEIGIRKNLSTGYLSLSGYYYDIKDRIMQIKTIDASYDYKGYVYSYINDPKSINQGIEFKYNFERDNQSLNFGYSYIDAKDSSGKQINLIPHNKSKIDYKFQVSSAMAFLASYSYFDKSAYDNKTLPSYELADISSSYKFQKNITLTASIKNLFDENYFYTYTDPAMGRSYYLTMNWKF